MATECIQIDGNRVETLRELVKLGLRAVFVGLNPSPVSVAAGHYYQGRLGKRFWSRLQQFGFVKELRSGLEDEDAFAQGYGFMDVVRLPTARANSISISDLRIGSLNLLQRLQTIGDQPPIVWVFKAGEDCAGQLLKDAGFKTMRMPGPYASSKEVELKMRQIQEKIRD